MKKLAIDLTLTALVTLLGGALYVASRYGGRRSPPAEDACDCLDCRDTPDPYGMDYMD